jgi:hypothetical protein
MSTFFQSGNDAKGNTLVVTQPPHFPTMHTRETVQHLSAFGLDENQVAVVLRCTPDDVRRYYAVEMEHGLMLVNSRVKAAVLHQALHKEDVNAMKLWLINNAGWRGGDGNKTNILNAPGTGPGEEGTLTIMQKREVITRLLVQATQHKRHQETVIDAEVVSVAKSTNGNGAGHGTNGANGHGGGNGKHR